MAKKRSAKKAKLDVFEKNLAVLFFLLVVASAGFALFAGSGPVNSFTAPTADDDPFIGDENAPVTMIMFSNHGCGFSRGFWENTFPALKEQYIDAGKVKFVYREMPGQQEIAGYLLAAGCANEQGAFWEYNERLYGSVYLDYDSLLQYAEELGLDTDEFKSCLDSKKYAAEIEKDRSDGIKAGVKGTPTFFINGQKVEGDEGVDFFSQVIEEEFAKA